MKTVSPELISKLVKLCGMFGSDFEGERSNAAALANRLVRDNGLTWATVIGCATPTLVAAAHQPPPRDRRPDRFTFGDLHITEARAEIRRMAGTERLTEWEEDFLAGCDQHLYRRPDKGLSNKQVRILNEIWRRVFAPEEC